MTGTGIPSLRPRAIVGAVGWVAVAGRPLGWLAAAAAAAPLPMLGAVALAWRDRWEGVRDDAILGWRALSHPRTTARLAEQRAALVEELDQLAARMPAERQLDRPSGVLQYVAPPCCPPCTTPHRPMET